VDPGVGTVLRFRGLDLAEVLAAQVGLLLSQDLQGLNHILVVGAILVKQMVPQRPMGELVEKYNAATVVVDLAEDGRRVLAQLLIYLVVEAPLDQFGHGGLELVEAHAAVGILARDLVVDACVDDEELEVVLQVQKEVAELVEVYIVRRDGPNGRHDVPGSMERAVYHGLHNLHALDGEDRYYKPVALREGRDSIAVHVGLSEKLATLRCRGFVFPDRQVVHRVDIERQ